MSVTQHQQRSVQQGSAARWLFTAVLTFALSVETFAAPDLDSFPVVQLDDGSVFTSASHGFQSGADTGHGIGLDATTALVDPRFPKVVKSGGGGQIYAIIDDTGGGWLIGGDFDTVGGVALTNLAHIRADFSVNSDWRPDPNLPVRALLFHVDVNGLRLLVGGDFTAIHGEPRTYFAELNSGSVSKPVTDLDLAIDGTVRTIVKDGRVYIGGDFTSVQGDGARDVNDDGHLDVDVDGTVDVDLDDDGVFETPLTVTADGLFDIDVDSDGDIDIDVNGDGVVDVDIDVDYNGLDAPILYTDYPSDPRQRIAALDLTLDSNAMVVTAWNPNVDGVVNVMSIAEGRGILHIGGAFSSITVKDTDDNDVVSLRQSIAALNVNSDINIVTPWNPAPTLAAGTATINAMSIELFGDDDEVNTESGLLYVGGEFEMIGGQLRENFAVLDLSLAVNNANTWNLPFDGTVNALARTDTTVYVGGEFTTVDGNSGFNGLAAVQRSDGTLLVSWQPQLADGAVNALAIDGGTLYVGGSFSSINDNSRLYIGGSFTAVDGEIRQRLVAFDSSSGVMDPNFDVGVDGAVRSIQLSSDGKILYVGGDFSAIGGEIRNRLAALDTATGVALPWNPDVNDTVYDLELSPEGNVLYLGGAFTTIGEATRRYVGAVNAASGNETAWDPSADGTVLTMELSGDTLFIGGEFLNLNTNSQNVARSRLAALDVTINSDNATLWAPAADNIVRDMALAGTTLYIAGDFRNINDTGLTRARDYLAALDTTANTFNVLNWNPAADDNVHAIELTDDAVFVGGEFLNIGVRLAALDFVNGAPLPWWDLGADGTVLHLGGAGRGDRMIVGGDFTEVTTSFPLPGATLTRRGLAAMDVAAPHVVTNPSAGAYQTPGSGPISISMGCVDTPRTCTEFVYYTIDGSDPVVGSSDTTQPLSISAVGGTVLKMVTEDAAGNQSPVQTALYVIDDQPPTTTSLPAAPQPDGLVLNSSDELEVRLVCSDGLPGESVAGCAETYYTIDGTEPTTASTRYLRPINVNNNTTLRYFSVDNAGNPEASTAANRSQYWVDVSAPTVIPSPPTKVFFSDGLSVSLLCSDDPRVTEASIGDIPDADNPPSPDDPPPNLNAGENEDENDRAETGCAAVYYTLDESEPTVASALYTGALSFSESTVIKFIAIDFGGNLGAVQRASYVRNYSDNAGASGPLALALILLSWWWQRKCKWQNSPGVSGARNERGVV